MRVHNGYTKDIDCEIHIVSGSVVLALPFLNGFSIMLNPIQASRIGESLQAVAGSFTIADMTARPMCGEVSVSFIVPSEMEDTEDEEENFAASQEYSASPFVAPLPRSKTA